MAHLPDLSAGGYAGYPNVLGVGWLDAPYPFSTGEVPPAFVERLEELLDCTVQMRVDLRGCTIHDGNGPPLTHYTLHGPWEPESAMGGHHCTLCAAADGAGAYGHRNLFVPGPGHAFMAPEMILHYVQEHGYKPPDAFIDAVMSCPPMRSEAYAKAMFDCAPGLFPPSGPRVRDGVMDDG